jgi:hypothetical protein
MPETLWYTTDVSTQSSVCGGTNSQVHTPLLLAEEPLLRRRVLSPCVQELNVLPNPVNINTLQLDYGWPCTEGFDPTPQYTQWLVYVISAGSSRRLPVPLIIQCYTIAWDLPRQFDKVQHISRCHLPPPSGTPIGPASALRPTPILFGRALSSLTTRSPWIRISPTTVWGMGARRWRQTSTSVRQGYSRYPGNANALGAGSWCWQSVGGHAIDVSCRE